MFLSTKFKNETKQPKRINYNQTIPFWNGIQADSSIGLGSPQLPVASFSLAAWDLRPGGAVGLTSSTLKECVYQCSAWR